MRMVDLIEKKQVTHKTLIAIIMYFIFTLALYFLCFSKILGNIRADEDK